MTPGSDFYATAAQVIPTLLLVAVVEDRLTPPDTGRVGRWYTSIFAAGALMGEVSALKSLFSGGSTTRATIVYTGAILAVCLTLQPLPGLLMTKGVPGVSHNRMLLTGIVLSGLAVAVAALL